MNERTPTPWAVNGLAIMSSPDIATQRPVGMAVHEPDLEFIVRACNAHDAMVEALMAADIEIRERGTPDRLVVLQRIAASLNLARGEV